MNHFESIDSGKCNFHPQEEVEIEKVEKIDEIRRQIEWSLGGVRSAFPECPDDVVGDVIGDVLENPEEADLVAKVIKLIKQKIDEKIKQKIDEKLRKIKIA